MYSSPFPPLNPRVKYRTAMERAGFDVNKSENTSTDTSPVGTSNNTPNGSKTDLFESSNGRSRAVSSSTTASTGLGKLMNKLKHNKTPTSSSNNVSKSQMSSKSPSPLSAKFRQNHNNFSVKTNNTGTINNNNNNNNNNSSTNNSLDKTFNSEREVVRDESEKNGNYGFNDLSSSIVKGDTSFIDDNDGQQNGISSYRNHVQNNNSIYKSSKNVSNTDVHDSDESFVSVNNANEGPLVFNPNTTLEHARQKSFDMLTSSLGEDSQDKDECVDDTTESMHSKKIDKVQNNKMDSSQVVSSSPSKSMSHNVPSVVMNNSVLDQVTPLSFSSPTKSLKRESENYTNKYEDAGTPLEETQQQDSNSQKDQSQEEHLERLEHQLQKTHLQEQPHSTPLNPLEDQPCNTQTSQQLHDLLSELNKASESKTLLANSIEPRSKSNGAGGSTTPTLPQSHTENVSSASTVVNDNTNTKTESSTNTNTDNFKSNMQDKLSQHESQSSGSQYSEYNANESMPLDLQNASMPVDSQYGIKFNSKSSAYLSGFPISWGKETEKLAKALQRDEMDTKTPTDHDFGALEGSGKEIGGDTVQDVIQENTSKNTIQEALPRDVIQEDISKDAIEKEAGKDASQQSQETKYPPGQGPCRKCHQEIDPITEKSIYSKNKQDQTQDIDVLSGQWHRRCFQCTLCDLKFNKTTPCYVLNDLPYCQYHYHLTNNSICTICSGFIEGECLENDQNERYHVHCLTCYICHEIINKDYYIYNNKLTICDNHDLDEVLKQGIPLDGDADADNSEKRDASGDDVVDRRGKTDKTENYLSKRRTRIIEF